MCMRLSCLPIYPSVFRNRNKQDSSETTSETTGPSGTQGYLLETVEHLNISNKPNREGNQIACSQYVQAQAYIGVKTLFCLLQSGPAEGSVDRFSVSTDEVRSERAPSPQTPSIVEIPPTPEPDEDTGITYCCCSCYNIIDLARRRDSIQGVKGPSSSKLGYSHSHYTSYDEIHYVATSPGLLLSFLNVFRSVLCRHQR